MHFYLKDPNLALQIRDKVNHTRMKVHLHHEILANLFKFIKNKK